jgi:hypothetical protein
MQQPLQKTKSDAAIIAQRGFPRGPQYASINSYGGKAFAGVEPLANGAGDSLVVAWR